MSVQCTLSPVSCEADGCRSKGPCVSWRLWCWKVSVSFKAPRQLESDITTVLQTHASHCTMWNLQPSAPRLALKVWVVRRRVSGILCRWECLMSKCCWNGLGCTFRWKSVVEVERTNRNCGFTWCHCYCVSRWGKRVICWAACWKDGV